MKSNKVSGTFLRATDGAFVREEFPVRDDLVSLPAGTMVLNQYMKRADYDDALKAFAKLADPQARNSFSSLASWYTYNRKGFEERVQAISPKTLAAFEKAGLKIDHTHLYAVDDHVNRNGQAGKDRVVDIGSVKLPETRCNFVTLSTHLGGLNMFEAQRVSEVFKTAGDRQDSGQEAAHVLAKRIQSASNLKMPAAITAARNFAADPKVVL